MPGRAPANQNIFSYFHAPTRNEGEQQWAIENNLTKSLILLLKHGTKDIFLRDFLKRLKLNVRLDDRTQFAIQRRPWIPDVKYRRLVCITDDSAEFCDSKQLRNGLPDAVITGRNWAVAIEAKLGCSIDQSQLLSHLTALGWPKSTQIMSG